MSGTAFKLLKLIVVFFEQSLYLYSLKTNIGKHYLFSGGMTLEKIKIL